MLLVEGAEVQEMLWVMPLPSDTQGTTISINGMIGFQEAKWFAEDHSPRLLFMGGNKGESSKRTVCLIYHPCCLFFFQRE